MLTKSAIAIQGKYLNLCTIRGIPW